MKYLVRRPHKNMAAYVEEAHWGTSNNYKTFAAMKFKRIGRSCAAPSLIPLDYHGSEATVELRVAP